jgi:hypothetical protein
MCPNFLWFIIFSWYCGFCRSTVLVVLFYIVMAGFCVAAQEEMQSELTKELLKVEVAGIKQELTIRGEILYVLSDL